MFVEGEYDKFDAKTYWHNLMDDMEIISHALLLLVNNQITVQILVHIQYLHELLLCE